MQNLAAWLQAHLNLWVLIGLFGQGLFMMRFLYQWIASERAKKSVMPEAFWYFSLGGGVIVFAYAVHQEDPVLYPRSGARRVHLSAQHLFHLASQARPMT